MVASDGQEIIGVIINHLLRSAVDLKSSVDTCGKPTGFPRLIPWTGRRQSVDSYPSHQKHVKVSRRHMIH